MKTYHIIIFLIFILFIYSLKYKEQFTIGSTENRENINNEISQTQLEITEILNNNVVNEEEKQRNIRIREIKNTLENSINPSLLGNTDENIYILNVPTIISE